MPAARRFIDRVRQFNKHTFNPWILKTAGEGRSPFAVVGHVGRQSGATYRTPVIAMPAQDGFVFALTYGLGVDWYRNILSAGSCTLRWHGKTYRLEQPETISSRAGLQAFPPLVRFLLRLNGKRDFFQMKTNQRPVNDVRA